MNRVFFAIIIFYSFIKRNNACLDNLIQNNVSAQCLKQMHTVCNSSELSWKMFDASSKFLTSGMTYSNVIDYGNFPECLSIDYEGSDGRIKGKFCALSHIIVNIFLNDETARVLRNFDIDTNATGRHRISKETFSQMHKQLVKPRDILYPDIPFVISKYSMCVPDACTPSEIGNFYLYGYLEQFQLLIYTNLTCETTESNTDYEWGDILFIVFLVIILVLMIASTIYDALCQNFKTKPFHPILLTYSVLYNGKKLLTISNNKTEQIQCFNGMRFISMMWILAFHAAIPYEVGVLGLTNFPEVEEWNNTWTNRYITSALLAVDTFFFIAGFLLAFSYLKTATKESAVQQIVKVPKIYLHRYLRLTPSVAAMYLVTITIYRFLGSGPMWSLVANEMKENCKQYWWQFFLYIQNYTNPDEMCVNPMWYLSADMQMFILAPLVLIPTALFIKKKFGLVIWSLTALTVFWVVCPMLIRYFSYGEAGNIYTSHDRFNNFLIGITFGAVMRFKKDKPFIFRPIVNVVLWIVVILVSLALNVYWYDVAYYYDLLKYTLFMGLYRPVWCLCLVFMVYSCYHGQGGIIQWLLTRPTFQILGKLSYSMYVLHVIVELYGAATLRTNLYFSNYYLFYNWCGHIIVTMIFSVIWVLAFEFPMLTLDKYLLGGCFTGKKPKAKTEKE